MVAEEAGKTVREGKPIGGPGGVAGRVGWRARRGVGQGLVAGRVGLLAGWDGGQGGEAGQVGWLAGWLEGGESSE